MATKTYRGGPYCFSNSLIAARVDSVALNVATIRVKSTNYPVVMTVAESAITETFVSETPQEVDFLAPGTYVCTFAETADAGPQNDTDTLSVTIA